MDALKVALPIVHLDAEGMGIKDAEAKLAELGAQLEAETGPPNQFEFQAVVFIQGPNRNFLRFYDDDMPAFARSFTGVPFLADHGQRSIEARYGTVLRSGYEAGEMVQTVRLSRKKAIEEFGAGLIDRFSIGWDYDDIVDSITGGSWFESPYWPGQRVKQADGSDKVCELYFVNPRGVETSAVNVPAVPGTHVLAQLSAAREEWRRSRPVLFAVGSLPAGDAAMDEDLPVPEQAAPSEEGEPEIVLDEPAPVDDSSESGAVAQEKAMDELLEKGAAEDAAERMEAVTPALPAAAPASTLVMDGPPPGVAPATAAQADAYLAVLAQQVMALMIDGSGLSAAGKEVVRAQLGATPTIEEIQAAIAGQRQLEEGIRAEMKQHFDAQAAALSAQMQKDAQTAVKGMVPSDGGKLVRVEDEIQRVQSVLDYLMGDESAPVPAPNMRSLRDVYLWMTEDYEWRAATTGWNVKRWGGATLAAGSVANLPNLLVNSLNRVMIEIFNDMSQYRWYEPLVSVVPHDGSTRTIDLITWNEVQDLPTVGEGEPYREAQLGDSREQMMFQKRGMWIGLTLEMIRMNDLTRVREVPRKLMRAAMRTRSATIASIWTQNSGAGPVMSDGKALFHLDHANLGTEAFSHNAWSAVRQRAFKQTEPGSGKRLGYMPEYLLIPVDLLETALTVFGYGAGDVGKPTTGGTAQEVNIYALAENRPKIIPVPEWLDATD
ncbi:MAG: hypothetical protein H6643_17215, partial [Caldilineaceae bacterium]|nr:hypothetical protein [Caldilineaceae bacterium]